ncbi:hypothetical protein [Ferruginibacter sp. HRS2-29]|uniref:hypothetical protein n=1 Tax=Ferruginibacter sp. HRS2-29 TaxID=2487334 RepID=UPI0020CFD08D|nr:hypothetical protein [Ferruginibacter sp. HRS2-29]MCP9750162.1 hypothetical protein [Ferruginibacter sp. HRS2-29]
MKIVGIALIAISILMLFYKGFTVTQEKKVAEIGPIEINKKEEKSVGWPIYAGGVAMAAGVFILLSAGKKKS